MLIDRFQPKNQIKNPHKVIKIPGSSTKERVCISFVGNQGRQNFDVPDVIFM